jgi:virulence-associated protein VapD
MGPNVTFDEYCDTHGEWVAMGNEVFIKKTAAFYYTDASLIRIHVLRRGSLPHEFTLQVKILKKTKLAIDGHSHVNKFLHKVTLQINQTTMYHAGSSSKYFYNVINARLDLAELGLARADPARDLRFMVMLQERLRNQTADSFVNMRVKRMSRDGFEKRKGSIVCAKCFYLTKADDYLTLRWWLELNRVTGHDSVFMCDHAIEKDRVFDELFEEYKDFIVFGRLKVCIF